MSNKSYDLSVIIPFRYDANLPYLVERLEEQCRIFSSCKFIEFIVVDSGSPKRDRKIVSDLCEKYGISYLYHNSIGKKFSIGEARDFGVQNAKGRLVTFLDVDLRVESTFWKRLVDFSRAFGIFENKRSFFVVPCLYLTSDGSIEFYKNNDDDFFYKAYISYLHGEKSIVESFAPCSSVMVVNRAHYLSVGGHRPEFRGHGYEDFELYHRLMVLDGVIPRSDTYYVDSKTWDGSSYNGFRAQLSLLGRAAMMANLFVTHIWHPRPKKSSFYGGMQVNREIWLDIFKEFDNSKIMPEPLVDSGASKERAIFFGKYGDNAPNCLRDVFPYIGKIVYVSEYDFCDAEKVFHADDFERFIKSSAITKIIFPNPYGNAVRLQIYEWCRRNNFPYLVFERGALPESWFFDNKGFNADSSSYSPDVWNNILNEEEKNSVENYIYSVLNEQGALEQQGVRLGGDGLAQKLKIGNKKVLFVPLQRPSDTVIKYFAGEEDGYERFLSFIEESAERMKRLGWTVLCKKHPLETKVPELKNVFFVDENTHFLDLLELSDAVALINSGVGIYSMMLNKPTYILGNAFYSVDGINKSIDNFDVSTFVNEITHLYVPDREKSLSFIHYLYNFFYSFGTPKVVTRKESDGSLRTITTGIDFYKVNVGGINFLNFSRDNRVPIQKTAPIFERFRLDIHNKQKKIVAAPSVKAVAPPVKAATPPVKAATPPVKAVVPAKPNSASKPVEVKTQEIVKPTQGEKVQLNNIEVLVHENKRNNFNAKIVKLKNNPKKFFLDSKKSHIRFFHKFF